MNGHAQLPHACNNMLRVLRQSSNGRYVGRQRLRAHTINERAMRSPAQMSPQRE
jgi:hypothetical protein